MNCSSADNDKAGKQAHDDRIPENSGHGDIGLYGGVFGVGCRRGDGRRADAGFIGEKPSCDAVAKGPLQPGAGHTAGKARKGEGVL